MVDLLLGRRCARSVARRGQPRGGPPELASAEIGGKQRLVLARQDVTGTTVLLAGVSVLLQLGGGEHDGAAFHSLKKGTPSERSRDAGESSRRKACHWDKKAPAGKKRGPDQFGENLSF